ncbi:ribonucleotide-diphosphate reductase [Longibacter salinarum]|uniref:R2-like ligand binding oxidase n=1 Tax=Longibacter salinarum TaxID=1850348 RepID=A0A2A8D2H2_9BACT|nr:R2-like ligand-binding oxidase [Longibacter salinarum]PEN15152.1 ribonucleotide-diphosphate reductase [Longibacter salinarum]
MGSAATDPYRSSFRTSSQGLDYDLVPMRLWRKAKSLGTWDPAEIDFSKDASDWQSLADDERDLLLRLTSQFAGGEESVTLDLLPMLMLVGREGRVEEEMFLTSYLWEEAKHVEGFDRFLRTVVNATGSLEHYFTDAYRTIFYEELPRSMNALKTDSSPETVARAAVTYQMIVEGTLAETGYHAYYTVLEARDILPGMQTFIRNVQRDESRHVGYGVYLLSRLVAEHGPAVWDVIDERMGELIALAISNIQETLGGYDPVPFGISPDDFVEYGMGQFQKRFARIEKARSQSLDEVLYDGASSSADGNGARGSASTRSASLPS